MSSGATIIKRQMNRSDISSERLPLRQVREHRKYHFLVDSSTSTSNDTNANHDDDTTATSFTTVASDNDGTSDDIVFISQAPGGPQDSSEPIFAVPIVCGCGQPQGVLGRQGDGYHHHYHGERYIQQGHTSPGMRDHRGGGLGGGGAGGGGGGGVGRFSFAVSGGGSSGQSSSSYSSNAHVPLSSETKSRTSASLSGGRNSDAGGYKIINSIITNAAPTVNHPAPQRRSNTASPLATNRYSSEKHFPTETTPLTITSTTASAPSSNSPSTTATTTITTTTTNTNSSSPTDSDPNSQQSTTSTKSGVSPILLLWSLLTVLVAGTCTFAFLQPFWVMHVDLVHTFGMVSYCFMDVGLDRSQEVCSAYGGYHHLANIPSGAWQAGCVLYGAGCVMLCVSSCLALSNLGMAGRHAPRVSLVAGYLQAIAEKLAGETLAMQSEF
ncbi:serine-rich adhesin for platelets-like [Littorina saxatilis]|uniref:serine-rich adhesin for platelets-like n=1 Tax=Littorina saxatilis TaxID=31220 RepID=UPI0038B52DCA